MWGESVKSVSELFTFVYKSCIPVFSIQNNSLNLGEHRLFVVEILVLKLYGKNSQRKYHCYHKIAK